MSISTSLKQLEKVLFLPEDCWVLSMLLNKLNLLSVYCCSNTAPSVLSSQTKSLLGWCLSHSPSASEPAGSLGSQKAPCGDCFQKDPGTSAAAVYGRPPDGSGDSWACCSSGSALQGSKWWQSHSCWSLRSGYEGSSVSSLAGAARWGSFPACCCTGGQCAASLSHGRLRGEFLGLLICYCGAEGIPGS